FQDNLANSVEDAGDNLRLEHLVVAVLCQVDEASQLGAVLCNVFQDGCVHCCALCVHASGCQGGCYCGGGVLHGVAFRCCSFLLPITIHEVARGCKSFPLLFIITFPGLATRSVGGGHNRHCHHVCNKRG